MKQHRRSSLAAAATAALGLHAFEAQAQLVINDTLNGASSSYNWKALNGACLTAGDGTGTIPACTGLAYYAGKTLVGGTSGRLPDLAGQGALRLTNGDYKAGTNGNYQTGAVVSNFTFPTTQGIQVTWTSVTYGGNNYNGTGADGISFFLSDGGTPNNPVPPTVGAQGGSLGYSCSNGNSVWDGVVGGYLGIGIDEFGNFSNKGDTTNTGDAVAGLHPKRISVRGAGSTAASALIANYPRYYGGMGAGSYGDAVHNTCSTGYLWNYTGRTIKDTTGTNISNGNRTNDKLAYNYPLLSTSDLPSTVTLANQEAIDKPLRGNAIPITYALKITSDGIMDFSYSVNGGTSQNVISGTRITASNGPLPASFRFGFSSGTGGGSNVHEITCFKAAQASDTNSSAGSNVQSGRADANSQVYLAFYHPQNWWGSLTANALTFDTRTNILGVNSIATWDAGCKLTGGACQSTNDTSNAPARGPASRAVLSSIVGAAGTNASVPVAFSTGGLGAAALAVLNAGEASLTSPDRLNYLRGDRSREVSAGGTYRNRTSVLADIVDSSPVWVGPPGADYNGPWADKLRPGVVPPEGTSYKDFATAQALRTNVVYVGANDGMLHGFRAGTLDKGKLTGTNDGHELLAYVPGQVVQSIHSASNPALDYSSSRYSHNFFVDATPATGELYYAGAWHTWLVGGLGYGGHPNGPVGDNNTAAGAPAGTLYALDITNPANFSEATPANTVIGEWSSASIGCVNDTACGKALGQVTGTPLIRRLHDGNWAVLFGNGLNSSSGTAGLFIMEIDSTTGARSFRFLDTRATGTGGALNGIANVTAADLDGDHVTDYVYAGDLLGNVWRFDLTDPLASNWKLRSTPVFNAGLPITSRVTVSSVAAGSATGRPKVLVAFGTGQKQPATLTSAESYAAGTQFLFGIWDWDMAVWNAGSSDVDYDALVAPQTFDASNLRAQSVTSTLAGTESVSGFRLVSTYAVCWKGSTACGTGSGSNTQFGWKMPLPSTLEQVVYNPTTAYGMFIVNTTIPATNNALSCAAAPASGYTMAVQLASGGAATAAPFFQDKSGTFGTANIGGLGTGGTGTPSIITYTNQVSGVTLPFALTQSAKGAQVPALNPSGGTGSRLNWIKVR